MSPEVVSKINYNENVDIWSLGVLLFELLHGYSPFFGMNKKDILLNIKFKEIGSFLIIVFN